MVKHSPPTFDMLNDNLIVVMYDRKARLLWTSDRPTNDSPMTGKTIYEFVDAADESALKDAVSRCVVHNEATTMIVHNAVAPFSAPDIGPRDYKVTLLPVDLSGGPGFVVVASSLPGNHGDFDEDDKKVLFMLAEDCTLKEVAVRLHRSESAIDGRIKNLKQKLKCNSLQGLVAAAIRYRII